MKHYLDITLLPDSDITLGFIWQKVYQQVHIALVDNKVGGNESAIAIAFPHYGDGKFPLGHQLRLLATTEAQLSKLNIQKWLNRFEDYVHIKSIQPVPKNAAQVCFVREQVKGQASIEKKMLAKAKHQSEKFGIPLDECLQKLEKSKPKVDSDIDSKLPFIWLESQQTKQRDGVQSRKFPLFIKKVEVESAQTGHFNCYGLSVNSKKGEQLVSVPHF